MSFSITDISLKRDGSFTTKTTWITKSRQNLKNKILWKQVVFSRSFINASPFVILSVLLKFMLRRGCVSVSRAESYKIMNRRIIITKSTDNTIIAVHWLRSVETGNGLIKKRELRGQRKYEPLFKCNTLATRFIVESRRESVSSISFPNSSSMLMIGKSL